MKNNRSLYIIIIVLALVGLLVAAYMFYRPPGKARYNWDDQWTRQAYSNSYDEPYGTRIFYNLLKGYFSGKKVISVKENLDKALLKERKSRASYVFVGGGMFMDSADTQALLQFVGKGNTAFISSKTIPYDLMNYIYYEECQYQFWNDYLQVSEDKVSLNFTDPELNVLRDTFQFYYAQQNKPRTYTWSYIEDRFFCDELPQEPLGKIKDSLINFARFPHGEGYFYLHTIPITLSNFHLLKSTGKKHAELLLSYLPEGDIIWDEYSRVPEPLARGRNGPNRRYQEEHPLSYILGKKSLAWAWYVLIGLSVLYILFRAKRRQRIIPVLPKNENSSYQFISTIANLHFREKNYRNLCIQQMRLFLAQVRERYGLVASIHSDDELPRYASDYEERLAQISGVPKSEISNIFTQYNNCIRYQPTEDMMVDLHLSLEQFSKKAK